MSNQGNEIQQEERPSKWHLLLNFVLFQIGWFACLLLDNLLPLVVTAAILGLHFFVIVSPTHRRDEALLLLKVLCVGLLLEWVYLRMGVLVNLDGTVLPSLWLLMIWVLFGSTFRYSLAWIRNYVWLASLFASVAAPLSYYAGANLNDSVTLGDSLLISLGFIAVSWALVFPVLMKIALPRRPVAA